MKLFLYYAIILVVLVVVGFFINCLRESFKGSKYTIWYEDDAVLIAYKGHPPRFREVYGDEVDRTIYCCGQCKYMALNANGSGIARCKKHDVEYVGVGCVTKSICDDYVSALLDD